MTVSGPAPPPIVASPPPCPAWSNTAVARMNESRIRMMTKIVYMRGARYLRRRGAPKLEPTARIEGRAAHQYAVQLPFRQQLGGVFCGDAAAVQNSDRPRFPIREPRPDRAMDLRGILRCRIAARANRPHRLIGDGHVCLHARPERRVELPCHHRKRLACLALREGLAHAQYRVQAGADRSRDFLGGLFVRLAEHVAALGVPDQRCASARLSREGTGDRARESAFRLPMNVLRAGAQIGALPHGRRHRFDRDRRRKEPHLAIGLCGVRTQEGGEERTGFRGPDVHLPVGGEEQRSHASSKAATPGNSFPSRNSSEAPPPVETWVNLCSSPATAATESPPPTTVTAPLA